MADRFPATFLQEWYFDAHDSGWSDLSVPVVLRLAVGYDETCLRRALTDLAARHESLRTTLVRTGAGVQQEVAPTGELPLTIGLGPLTAAVAEPFQVRGGPLARAVLFPAADGGAVLLVHAHHAVCDGWSAGLVHRDLTELYRARRAGRAPMLPPLDLQLGDYAAWESAARLRAAPAYWRDRLGQGHPRLRLGASADNELARLRSVPLTPTLPAAGRALGALAAELGTTLSRVVGALAVAAVRPYAGDRVVVGLITSNRHRPELREVVGDLWDQLPISVDLSGDPTLTELVVRFDDAVTGAQDHQVPLATLAPLLRAGQERQTGPLFDVRLNHFPGTGPADADRDEADEPAPARTHVVDRWWTGLSLLDFQYRTRHDGGIDLGLLVNTAAVPVSRIERLGERFGRLMAEVATVGGRR